MKTGRRKSREQALQALYQLDMNHELNVTRALSNLELAPDDYATSLVEGVYAHRPELDEKIKAHAENWRLDRMAAIDRNILRLGVYELFYVKDVPVEVSLDEAIELAKEFGSENSPAFVNGILDKIKESVSEKKKAL